VPVTVFATHVLMFLEKAKARLLGLSLIIIIIFYCK